MSRAQMKCVLASTLFIAAQAVAAQTVCDDRTDAWIEGRLSTAFLLNARLNPIGIEFRVDRCVVMLEGTVENEIDRDLALRIAEGVDHVAEIQDAMGVKMAAMGEEERRISERQLRFRQWVEDATTTALVREQLRDNRNITSADIEVETHEGVVVLSGTVAGTTDRTMAELVARNVDGVEAVRNRLDVSD